MNRNARLLFFAALSAFLLNGAVTHAQMITGVWKGKINRQKAEIKIIQNGDSLTGTAYYYESPGNYRRYSIRGYYDSQTNEAVWWDDQLLDASTARSGGPGKMALLSRADFNCPGDGRMMLDGKAGKLDDPTPDGDLHLDKTGETGFPDEWDYVIENYTIGANDPFVIDSIGAISSNPIETRTATVTLRPVINVKPLVAPTIEEKFTTRKKVLVTEIPVTGDSVELRFYDNAEIDGDSISLFLNEKLIFTHIRLTGSAYTIRIPVNELGSSNELIMVAENLGSIPPNTSYMVALVGDKRYEARLESTEGSSAMVRFVKKP